MYEDYNTKYFRNAAGYNLKLLTFFEANGSILFTQRLVAQFG